MSRTASFAGLIALGIALTVSDVAGAQSAYPSKPIQLIVPFPPGASTDLLGRYLGTKLKDALGQAVVVENRPGAAGAIGASYVAKSAPDGHTLLIASSSVTNAPQLQKIPDVRHHARPRADRDRVPAPVRAGRLSEPAGRQHRGADRLREGQSRQAQHRDARRLQ